MHAQPPKVVFLDRFAIRAPLRALRFDHEWVEYPTTAPEEAVARLAGARIAITNRVRFDDALLAQAPGLELIAVSATGYECIDIEACRRRGVTVTNLRDWSTPAVAEHTFAMILALRRQLARYHAAATGGAWAASNFYGVLFDPLPPGLIGATLGIIGHGALGRRLAALGAAFDMQVLIAERKGQPPRDGRAAFTDVLARADVLCVACPALPDTVGLIGAAELARMRPSAVLINTARGGIVDEQALADALRAGRLAGAGVDSLSREPPRDGNPLLAADVPNLILTPHMAFASDYTLAALAEQLLANIEAFVAGERRNVVT